MPLWPSGERRETQKCRVPYFRVQNPKLWCQKTWLELDFKRSGMRESQSGSGWKEPQRLSWSNSQSITIKNVKCVKSVNIFEKETWSKAFQFWSIWESWVAEMHSLTFTPVNLKVWALPTAAVCDLWDHLSAFPTWNPWISPHWGRPWGCQVAGNVPVLHLWCSFPFFLAAAF